MLLALSRYRVFPFEAELHNLEVPMSQADTIAVRAKEEFLAGHH